MHSVDRRLIPAQLLALDELQRQLAELYELQERPAAPTGDYTPQDWQRWRAESQHAYGVREGLLIAMTVGASRQTALRAQLLVAGPSEIRLAGANPS